MNALKDLIKRYQLASLLVLTLLLAVVLPLTLDIFRLNLVGKYLTYAFVAIGLLSGLSMLFYMRLAPDAGAEVSGHGQRAP